jgi:hypothetical protein
VLAKPARGDTLPSGAKRFRSEIARGGGSFDGIRLAGSRLPSLRTCGASMLGAHADPQTRACGGGVAVEHPFGGVSEKCRSALGAERLLAPSPALGTSSLSTPNATDRRCGDATDGWWPGEVLRSMRCCEHVLVLAFSELARCEDALRGRALRGRCSLRTTRTTRTTGRPRTSSSASDPNRLQTPPICCVLALAIRRVGRGRSAQTERRRRSE